MLATPPCGFLRDGALGTARYSASSPGLGRYFCDPAPPQFLPLLPEHSLRGRETVGSRGLPRSRLHLAAPIERIACALRAQVKWRRRGLRRLYGSGSLRSVDQSDALVPLPPVLFCGLATCGAVDP